MSNTVTPATKSSEFTAIRKWIGQSTTGHGFAVVAGTVITALQGTISWTVAAPLIVGGVIGMLWPENTPLQTTATTLATEAVKLEPDVMNVAEAYLTGVKHGNGAAVTASAIAALVPPPPAAPTTETPPKAS